MKPSRLLALTLLALSVQAFAAKEQQTVRPQVGEPLQAAQQALQAKQYKDALAKIGEAEAVGDLTSYEAYVVARMRSAAATGAGDYNTAVASYEKALASPEFPEGEKLSALEAIAKLTYTGKNYGKAADAIDKYRAAGGTNAQTLSLLPQALYLSGKYGEAGKELSAILVQMEKNGQAPSETQLQLLASCALKQNDGAGYVAALEKMVAYHPSQEYWRDLLSRTASKPGFSDKLTLDVYRLKLRTGTLRGAGDYMEATQLALQAGFPGEAEKILKEGYEKKLLGSGAPADVDRHKRLSDLVTRKVQEDQKTLVEGEKAAAALPSGDGLVATGMNYVGYGQYDKGIELIQQGITKGNLKRPDDAKLHLGIAQLLAGQKDTAAKTLRSVQGKDGPADLAKLWVLQARNA